MREWIKEREREREKIQTYSSAAAWLAHDIRPKERYGASSLLEAVEEAQGLGAAAHRVHTYAHVVTHRMVSWRRFKVRPPSLCVCVCVFVRISCSILHWRERDMNDTNEHESTREHVRLALVPSAW